MAAPARLQARNRPRQLARRDGQRSPHAVQNNRPSSRRSIVEPRKDGDFGSAKCCQFSSISLIASYDLSSMQIFE